MIANLFTKGVCDEEWGKVVFQWKETEKDVNYEKTLCKRCCIAQVERNKITSVTGEPKERERLTLKISTKTGKRNENHFEEAILTRLVSKMCLLHNRRTMAILRNACVCARANLISSSSWLWLYHFTLRRAQDEPREFYDQVILKSFSLLF